MQRSDADEGSDQSQLDRSASLRTAACEEVEDYSGSSSPNKQESDFEDGFKSPVETSQSTDRHHNSVSTALICRESSAPRM